MGDCGKGGTTSAIATISLGGTTAISTNGDINAYGAPGNPGTVIDGKNNVGVSGLGGSNTYGSGGNSVLALPGNTSNAGNAGTGYGAGGGGGVTTNNGTGVTGGAGTAGLIVVWEFY